MISQFMKDVREEKNGFSFGKVFRFDEESVVAILPIIRESQVERDYIVLPEAKDVKIEDTGDIDKAKITNNGDKPVYIRSGTVLKGSTQERASVISRIIFPNQTKQIKVVCVHQTKGISIGAKMDYSGLTPSSISLGSQQATWNSVNKYTCCARNSFSSSAPDLSSNIGGTFFVSPTDDLHSYMKDYSKKIEKILSKIEYKKNQTGMALFDVEGVFLIEIFDLTGSWKAIRDDVISREGENIIKKDLQGIFQLKPERANELVINILNENYKEKELHKNQSSTYALEGDKYIGETTILNQKVIHFSLMRKSKN